MNSSSNRRAWQVLGWIVLISLSIIAGTFFWYFATERDYTEHRTGGRYAGRP